MTVRADEEIDVHHMEDRRIGMNVYGVLSLYTYAKFNQGYGGVG